MGEQVAEAASKLVPLLLLLLAIFGTLIVVVIVLRIRLKHQTSKPSKKNSGSPVQMQPDDVITVLGKTFEVKKVSDLPAEAGQEIWCWLEGETNLGRLNLSKDMQKAYYYPGQSDIEDGQSFPEKIERDNRSYERQAEALTLSEGWQLARYLGPSERMLAIEVTDNKATLWHGKSNPPEGVELLEEK